MCRTMESSSSLGRCGNVVGSFVAKPFVKDESQSGYAHPDMRMHIGNVVSVSASSEGDYYDILYEDGDAETMDESEFENLRVSEERATQLRPPAVSTTFRENSRTPEIWEVKKKKIHRVLQPLEPVFQTRDHKSQEISVLSLKRLVILKAQSTELSGMMGLR